MLLIRKTVMTPGKCSGYGLFLIFVLVAICSCHEVFFNDDRITRVKATGGFHSVEISGIFNVLLVQDSSDYILISGSNDTDKITAAVTDSILVINSRGKIVLNTTRNDLEIHFTKLVSLVTFDPVDIVSRGKISTKNFHYDALGEIVNAQLAVDCDFFRFVSSGNTLGNLHIRGRSGECYFFNQYGTRVFADSLSCTTATIINKSAGDVRVNATDNIYAYIHGPGNICYYGNPVVETVEKRGSGRVIRIGD